MNCCQIQTKYQLDPINIELWYNVYYDGYQNSVGVDYDPWYEPDHGDHASAANNDGFDCGVIIIRNLLPFHDEN